MPAVAERRQDVAKLDSIVSDASGIRKNARRVSYPPDDALDHVSEFAQQGRLALRADDAFHRSTVLEQDHRRNRDDLEVTCGRRIGVDVDLGDRQLPGLLA